MVQPCHNCFCPIFSRILGLHRGLQQLDHTHLGLMDDFDQSLTTTHQLPSCLKLPIWNKAFRQLTSSKVLGQPLGTLDIRFTPIPRTARNRFQRSHHLINAQLSELVIQHISARGGFEATAELAVVTMKIFSEVAELYWLVRRKLCFATDSTPITVISTCKYFERNGPLGRNTQLRGIRQGRIEDDSMAVV